MHDNDLAVTILFTNIMHFILGCNLKKGKIEHLSQ